jgi:hypothetical protein
VNPDYTAWRKANIYEKAKPKPVPKERVEWQEIPKSGVEIYQPPVAREDDIDAPLGALERDIEEAILEAEPVAAVLMEEEIPEQEPEPDPNFLTLPVIKLPPNASFVLCGQDGVTVPVKIKRGMQKKLMRKMIRVERMEDGTLEHRP